MSRTKNITLVYPSELVTRCQEAIETLGSHISLFRFSYTPDNSKKDRVYYNLEFLHNTKGWVTIKFPIINYTYVGKPIDETRTYMSSMNLGIPIDSVYYRASDNRMEPLGEAMKYIGEAQLALIKNEFKKGYINPTFASAGNYLAASEFINEKTGENMWWGNFKITCITGKNKNGTSKQADEDSKISGKFIDGEKTDYTKNPIEFVDYTVFNETTGEEEELNCGNIHHWSEQGMVLQLAYVVYDVVSIDIKNMSGKGILNYCIKLPPQDQSPVLGEEDDELNALFFGAPHVDTITNEINNEITTLEPIKIPTKPVETIQYNEEYDLLENEIIQQKNNINDDINDVFN